MIKDISTILKEVDEKVKQGIYDTMSDMFEDVFELVSNYKIELCGEMCTIFIYVPDVKLMVEYKEDGKGLTEKQVEELKSLGYNLVSLDSE